MWKPKSIEPAENGEYIVTLVSKQVTLCIWSARTGWDLKGVIGWQEKPEAFIPDDEVLAAVLSGAPLIEEDIDDEGDFVNYFKN